MDESLALALEGVRSVQQVCSEAIILHAGRDDGDRTIACACADVEEGCLSVLGGTAVAASASASAASSRPANSLNPLSLLSAAKPLQDMFRMGGAQQPTDSSRNGALSESEGVARSNSMASRHGLQNYKPLRLTSAHIAPLTDIVVLHGDDAVPAGFIRLSTTISGAYPADLNASSGSRQLWLATARMAGAPPITGLVLVALELGEYIPPGFSPVRRAASGRPANLRYGAPNTELVLCYSRAPGAPILDVGLAFPAGALLMIPKLPGSSKPPPPCASSTTRSIRAVGTMAALEAAEAVRAKGAGVGFLGMGAVGAGVQHLVSMLGPAKEELPLGYAPLSRTVLGAPALCTGGSARGSACIVVAKDTVHVDALGDARVLLPLARLLVPAVERESGAASSSPSVDHDVGGEGAEGGGGYGPYGLDAVGEEALMRAADVVARGSACGAAVPLALALARAHAAGAIAHAVGRASGQGSSGAAQQDESRIAPSTPTAAVRESGNALTAPSSGLFGKTFGAMSRLFRSGATRADSGSAATGSGAGGGDPSSVGTGEDGGERERASALLTPAVRESSGLFSPQAGAALARMAGPSTGSLEVGATRVAELTATASPSGPEVEGADVVVLDVPQDGAAGGARLSRARTSSCDLPASEGHAERSRVGGRERAGTSASGGGESEGGGRPRMATESSVSLGLSGGGGVGEGGERLEDDHLDSLALALHEVEGGAMGGAMDRMRVRALATGGEGGGMVGGGAGEGHGADSAAAKLVLYRHMSWIASPAATRMTLAASAAAAADGGGAGAMGSPSGRSDPDGVGLRGFLSPSIASITLAPLLRGLYCGVPEVVAACLEALSRIADRGWFMAGVGGRGKDSEGEAGLRAACALALLDVALACAVDACATMSDSTAGPLLEFIRAAFAVQGAGPPPCPPLRTAGWCVQPWGMHPTSLHRSVGAALAKHAFFQQKRIYAERGAHFCERAGQERDAVAFRERGSLARKQAGSTLGLARELVAGIAASLERDGVAGPDEPLARACLRGGAAVSRDKGKRLVGRSRFGGYADIGRAYAAHAVGTASMCSELHAASSPFILKRPFPLPIAHEAGGELEAAEAAAGASALAAAVNPADPFGVPVRSPALDVLLLLAILCKASGEGSSASDGSGVGPLGLSAAWAAAASTGGSHGSGGWKRLSYMLQKDAALLLLQDVFSATGPMFACTPLTVGSVPRLLVPALLSHAFTARMLTDHLSVCPVQTLGGGADGHEDGGVQDGSIVAGGSGGKVGYDRDGLPLPTSLYRAVVGVVGAMWASRGADEEVSGAVSGTLPAGVTDVYGEPLCLSVREACCREISALARALLLAPLACRSTPPGLRLDALEELSTWCASPQSLLELYINADQHPGSGCPYPHTRLVRPLLAALVATAVSRRAGGGLGPLLAPSLLPSSSPALSLGTAVGGALTLLMAGGEVDGVGIVLPHPDNLPSTATPGDRAIAWDAWGREEGRRAAGSLLSSLTRALMDSSATVHMSAGMDEEDGRGAWDTASPSHPAKRVMGAGSSFSILPPTPAHSAGAGSSPARLTSSYSLPLPSGQAAVSVRLLHAAQDKAEAGLYACLAIAHDKGAKKGMAALCEEGYVHRSGGGMAHFLRMCGQEVGQDAEIGDFLGEEGRSEEEKALMRDTRSAFLGGMSFAGLPFDEALRMMLTRGGFRLPGEAQKIDRLTQAFAAAYCGDNKPSASLLASQAAAAAFSAPAPVPSANEGPDGKPKAPRSIAFPDGRLFPGSPDVVEILAFSCIMLNTDAHNPSIKKERKMTAKQFVSNNRGIDSGGADLPPAFLEHLYTAIAGHEIKMNIGPGPPSGDGGVGGGAGATGGAAEATGAGASSSALSVVGVARASGAPLSLLPPSSALQVTAAGLAGLCCLEPEMDAYSDAAVFLKALGTVAARTLAFTHSACKADDARAVSQSGSISPSPSSASAQSTASAFPTPPVSLDTPPGGPGTGHFPLSSPSPVPHVSPVWFPVPYKRTFSGTTVTCALLDLWPHALAFAHYVLRLQPAPGAGGGPVRLMAGGLLPDVVPAARLSLAPAHELDLRLSALDTLKAGISAALFLGPGPAAEVVATGAAALVAVEAGLCGPERARASRTGGEGWCVSALALVAGGGVGGERPDLGACAEAVGLLHMAVAELKEAATAAAEAVTLATTAARFKGDLGKLLDVNNASHAGVGGGSSRRLLYEGDITKVASGGRGKHAVYRFWLFNDLLVYGSKGAFGSLFSDKYAARQAIPLSSVHLQPDPTELTSAGVAPGLGWRLDTAVKPLFLVAPSEGEALAWKRHIREALGELSRAAEEEEDKAAALKVRGRAGSLQAVPAPAPAPPLPVSPAAPPEYGTIGRAAAAGARFLSAQAVAAELQAVVPPPLPPPGPYDSLTELKAAFLRAVSFCRPLLMAHLSGADNSGEGGGGRGVSPSGSAALGLSDEAKLAFYGLFKQGTGGDCPAPSHPDDISMMLPGGGGEDGDGGRARAGTEVDPAATSVALAKRDAWRTYSGMRRRDAMRKFCELLDAQVPSWAQEKERSEREGPPDFGSQTEV